MVPVLMRCFHIQLANINSLCHNIDYETTFFCDWYSPTYLRDKHTLSASTALGIVSSAASLQTAACRIHPTSIMPYSAAPGEPPLANSVPSPAGHHQFYKVNCGFVGSVCVILSSYCTSFYHYCDFNMSSGFCRSFVGSGLRMDDSLHVQNGISGLVCLCPIFSDML